MGIMNAITIKNLSFSFGEKPILKDINLDLEQGKFIAVLGKNGSGKTTLLKLIAGLLKYSNGEIFLNDNELRSLSLRKRANYIAYLAQTHRSVFPFLVKDVVLTGRVANIRFTPSHEDRTLAQTAMEKAGILNLQDRYYTELSGGEQQLVLIARVLAQNPKVLLLDEPTSYLDFTNQSHILKLLKEFTYDGMTVISVLHDPNAAFLFGDRFVFLRNGKIIPPPSFDITENKDFLEYIYDVPLEMIKDRNKSFVLPQTINNDY